MTAMAQSEGKGRALVRWLQHAQARVDRLADRLLPQDNTSTLGAPDQYARRIIMIGLALMFLLFGVIGLWSALVPLATGAVAPGRPQVSGGRQALGSGLGRQIARRKRLGGHLARRQRLLPMALQLGDIGQLALRRGICAQITGLAAAIGNLAPGPRGF